MSENPDRLFGQRLRRLRERQGWTQAQLAERMGDLGLSLHASAIAKIEAGSRPLRLSEAKIIALVLGETVDGMLGSDELDWPTLLADFRRALDLHVEASRIGASGVERMYREIGGRGADLLAAIPERYRESFTSVLHALEGYSPRQAKQVQVGALGDGELPEAYMRELQAAGDRIVNAERALSRIRALAAGDMPEGMAPAEWSALRSLAGFELQDLLLDFIENARAGAADALGVQRGE